MNTTKSRRRIVRQVVGAILTSSLSDDELEFLCDELASCGGLALEIGRAAASASGAFEVELSSSTFPPRVEDYVLNDMILDALDRNAITRRELVEYFGRDAFSKISANTLSKMSTKELVSRLVRNMGEKEINDLILFINRNVADDPFLKGIKKNKA